MYTRVLLLATRLRKCVKHQWRIFLSLLPWLLYSSDSGIMLTRIKCVPVPQITLNNQRDSTAGSVTALHGPRECSACSWINCHITSASPAAVLTPVLKPLISVPVHSDCWLTRLRLQASKLFPLPSHILAHILLLDLLLSLKLEGFLRVWLRSDLIALYSGQPSPALTSRFF